MYDYLLDKYLFKILNEYDASLSKKQARIDLASYGLACCHDKSLAEEAFKIVTENSNNGEEN